MGFFSASSWAVRNHAPALPQCGACGLARTCITPRMKVSGRGRNGVLVVDGAPGEQEDRQGTQFVGDDGALLRSVLHEIHIDLEDCWKTNAVICRPPKNEIDQVYVESCRPNLLRTIAELKPKAIILLGLPAVISVIGTEWGRNIGEMGRWAGWRIPSPTYRAWLCPIYHPAYLGRMKDDPVLHRIIRGHLAAAFAAAAGGRPPASDVGVSGACEAVLVGTEVRARLRALTGESGPLAFDFEANMRKPDSAAFRLVCCSFCRDGKTAWAGMIGPRELPLLSAVLRRPQLLKIASNLKYEERVTRAVMGHPVAAWWHDTMLAAHVIDNRPDITSVKFQAYILEGQLDYEESLEGKLKGRYSNRPNRIDEIHLKDLLEYCATDSLVEFKVAMKQRAVLGLPL